MISDSWYWKQELSRLLKELNKWTAVWASINLHGRKLDNARFHLERATFFSALAMRRLLESKKITHTLEEKSLKTTYYPCKVDRFPSLMSYHGPTDLNEWIDFSSPATKTISPKKLVSEIIHSFILEFYISEDGNAVEGIWIASEYNAFSRVIDLPMPAWLALVKEFITDDVTHVKATWNPETGQVVQERR